MRDKIENYKSPQNAGEYTYYIYDACYTFCEIDIMQCFETVVSATILTLQGVTL